MKALFKTAGQAYKAHHALPPDAGTIADVNHDNVVKTISPDWVDGETKVMESPADHGQDLRLWLRLLTCSTLIEGEIRRRLREQFDCTLPRFDLMAQLERAKAGMVLGELSKRMMVSPGNITALVERLVESGHVTRTVSAADRRVQIIALTSFGRAEFEKMATAHADWIAELFDVITAREGQILFDRLGKLKRSVVTALARD
ncbi:transcriptional regulator [Mesorhizobium amorphae CCNWGS0123]|uniref:Transcriptional regulator n=2 Tax=Mesorhizobium amorphae TaxID=71433 RepID=G6YFA6_9HYPH|nr:transcriptional regulator [Mesorhizobium amorphae CCNWGS0123]